jgi:IS30 family transposase
MICPHCGGHIAWKNIDEETKKAILKLHKQGLSLRDIAQLLNVSFSSAGRVIRKERTR